MRAQEGFTFSNIAATTATFKLEGGRYQTRAIATWGGGSVTFQTLGPDGTTWMNVDAAYTANGGGTYDLPPGDYRFAVVTATGIFIGVYRIPVGE